MSHVFAETQSPAARRGDAFLWRFAGTAFSFAMFGMGALLLSLTILPALRLLPRTRGLYLSRRVLRRGMRLFVGLMRTLGVLTYEIRGGDRLGQRRQLIVANHPTLIDAVFLIAFTPQACCVAKRAMFRNPLTRSVVAAAGYISNESTAEMIESAAAALAEGQCLIMFPEATRTRSGEPLAFHRGAANVALRAAAQVTPVFIRCEPLTLIKAEPWYRIPPRRPHFSLVTGEDLPLDDYRAMPSIPLGSRAFNARMRDHFESVLRRPDGYTCAGDGNKSPVNS
jgi:1-acyl-sn-glycerol-3-phosphate acyltransferase